MLTSALSDDFDPRSVNLHWIKTSDSSAWPPGGSGEWYIGDPPPLGHGISLPNTSTPTPIVVSPAPNPEMEPWRSQRANLKLLPSGDVDLPEYCTRCGAELEQTRQVGAGPVYSSRTGKPVWAYVCPEYDDEPTQHDAWVSTKELR